MLIEITLTKENCLETLLLPLHFFSLSVDFAHDTVNTPALYLKKEEGNIRPRDVEVLLEDMYKNSKRLNIYIIQFYTENNDLTLSSFD